MKSCRDYIESGILELYVLGQTSPEESLEIQQAAHTYPEIQKEILEIELALEKYAMDHAVEPDPIVKPFLMATIDYTNRLQNGEQPSSPPLLSPSSKVSDYAPWIDREDMVLPEDFDGVFAKILAYTPEAISAIVWIKEMAPQEVHDNEYERFLILEGTCDITIEDEVHQLVPGDYLSIPLHKKHHVTITSTFPCKVILQRVAA